MTPKHKYGGILIAEADKEKGEKFDIIAAVTENGKCPFWDEFFLDLNQRYNSAKRKNIFLNKKDDTNYKKLDYFFDKFSKTGPWSNEKQIRKIEDGFFEFKCIETSLRVIFYYDKHYRNVIVLTHYFDKGGNDKTPPKEKEKMHRIKDSFEIYRRKGG
jgi:phage-related protein